jgi:hypothetical protein
MLARMRAWRGAAALTTLTMAASSSSLAQPTGMNRVDVVIVAAEPDAEAMRAVVDELMARLRIAATVTFAKTLKPDEIITPQRGADARLARAWVDLSTPERATIYLVDRDWARVLVRHVQTMGGHEELAREAIGHILETAVDALAHGARIGIANEQPPTNATPDSRIPPPHWELGAAYEGEVYAPGLLADGPVASFYVGSSRGAVRPGGWLIAQYRLPLTFDSAPLGVRLDGGGARALATMDVVLGTRAALRFGVGPGVDVVRMTPRLEGRPGTQLGSDQTFALFIGRVSAAVVASLSTHLDFSLTASCDIDPSGTRYSASVDGADQTVFSPWAVRPALSVGWALTE